MSSIEELTKDLEEIKLLMHNTPNLNNFNRLANEFSRIRQEIKNDSYAASTNHSPIELGCYTFDQSEEFVKVFVALDGIDKSSSEDNFVVYFSPKSLCFLVYNVNGKDYKFQINDFVYEIDPTKSYHRIKKNVIVIYGKKVEAGLQWPELTVIQTKLKAIYEKQDKLTEGIPDDPNDPSVGHLNFMLAMKQIYETGDIKIKQKIAQACARSEDRIKSGELVNDF